MPLSVPGKVLCRTILERLRTTVDDMLRNNQASIEKDPARTRSLLYELPQSSPLNGMLPCMPTVWMLKRLSTAWKLMRHYAIPEKFVILIHNTCEGMTCNNLSYMLGRSTLA